MLDTFRRVTSFFIGLAIVIGGIMEQCPQVAVFVVGLSLMGLFTIPEALGLGKPKTKEDDK